MSYTTWADYRLELYDGSRANPVVLDDAINLRYRRRLFGGGDFSFSLHILSSHASYLTTTGLHYVRIFRRNTCVFDGVIYKVARKYKESGRGLTEYIDVAGVRLGAAVASWRVGLSDNSLTHFAYTGLVDDGFKYLISKTHGSGAYTISGARAITGFTVAADKSERAGSIELDATGINMYEFLDRWGRYYEVDWDITFDASMNFVFETYYPRRGVDRTEDNGVVVPVIMNDAGEELTEVDYFADAVGYVNAIIGETLDLEQIDGTGITAYQRREMVAGTSETEALKILLADKKLHVGYKQGFAETAACRYITDWDVGDLVTQNNLHLGLAAADALIVEVVTLINKQGQEELQVCFGDYPRGLEDRLRGTGAGGGGGYGDTPGGKTSRLWGLRGDAAIWVKPDDTNIINISGGTGMDVTESANTLTLTCTIPAYSLPTPGTLTVITTNSAAGAHTHAITSSADVSGGGAKILACDANGDLKLRNFTAAGGYIYLTDTSTYIRRLTNYLWLQTDQTYIQFAPGGTARVAMDATSVFPNNNNAVSSAIAASRWSNVFTVLLDHSGTTAKFRGIQYTLPSADAAGVLTSNGAGTLGWTGPAYATHVHTYDKANTPTENYAPGSNSPVVDSSTFGGGTQLYFDATGHVNTSTGTMMWARSGTHAHSIGYTTTDSGVAK